MTESEQKLPLGQTVRVDLGDRSYDIHVGEGVLGRLGDHLKPLLKRDRVALVTDANVAERYLEPALRSLKEAGIKCAVRIVPPGEQSKNFSELEQVLNWLLDERIERGDLLVALGGGVVGDLTGFAAAVLRRGVDFAQVPTTLLSQVNSSVGGKTGINTRHGKNLIGAFHQPRVVIADIEVLQTLPPRELLAGYAEVVKYGLLGDHAFFDWLETAGPAIRAGDVAARLQAVVTSCAAKARIVAEDERESGKRALLNLGHTFGHALESETGFSDRLLHGEGVAIGMCLAFDVSVGMGIASGQDRERVTQHIARMGLPSRISDIPGPQLGAENLLAHMAQDKKVAGGRINFIIPRSIGDCFVTDRVDPGLLKEVLARSAN